MKRKIIILIGIIIIICTSLIYLSTANNSPINTNTSTPLYGETITINGYNCKISEKYSNGSITINNSGINTYGTNNGSIYITVYNNNEEGDRVWNGDMSYFAYGESNVDNNPKRENKTIDGHNLLYVIQHSDTRGDYRMVFFTVENKRVSIEWIGNTIDNDIKNIINSFYQLN